jgi:hypothetical protein
MSISKKTLTIKNYWNSGGDLDLKLNDGFALQISSDSTGKVKKAKLTITRKPDKHSTRLGMFAFLHTKDDYQNLGFSEVTMIVDTYSDAGKFISRKVYTLFNVIIESSLMRGNDEELVFVASGISQLEISQVGVFFN